MLRYIFITFKYFIQQYIYVDKYFQSEINFEVRFSFPRLYLSEEGVSRLDITYIKGVGSVRVKCLPSGVNRNFLKICCDTLYITQKVNLMVQRDDMQKLKKFYFYDYTQLHR